MALIKKFDIEQSSRTIVHKPVHRATIRLFESDDGKKVVNVSMYGSASRKKPDGISQSIQFGPEAIAQLKRILEEV